MAFARHKPRYTQVRLLNAQGQEVIRVDRNGEHLRAQASEALQDKSDRYYVTQARTSPAGTLYISPFDLNRERGEIERPFKPVLRVAMSVTDGSGAVAGIVVLNVLGRPLLESLRQQGGPSRAVMLVDRDGFYMVHPDPAQAWGGSRDLDTGASFFRDFPDLVDSLGKETGTVAAEVTWLQAGANLMGVTSLFALDESRATPWTLVSLQPWDVIFAEAQFFRRAFLGVFGATLLLVSGLQVLVIRGVTRPLVDVLEGVRRIGEGQLQHRVTVGTGDELQALAEEFNEMAQRLEAAQAYLEREVQAATGKLEERNVQLKALYETGITLAAEYNLDKVLQKVVDLSQTLTRAQYGALGVLGPDGTIARLFVAGVATDQQARIGGLPRNMGILGALLHGNTPIRVAELTGDPRAAGVPPHHPLIRSFLGVPIIAKGRSIGHLYLGNKLDGPEFTEEDENAVLMLAAQASIAIENAQLHATEQETVTKLQELDELKSDFVAMVTHELRTPIAAVRGFAKVLLEHAGKIDEPRREGMLRLVEQEAAHLGQLIEDVLSVTRIEAGRMDYLFRPIPSQRLLEEVGREAASRTNRHDIVVCLGEDAQAAVVNADPDLLKQVLVNLVDNAVKFSPQGGPIQLGLRVDAESGEAVMTVADQGVGMAPEDLPKIFQKFSRIQRDETRAIPGTGLGLYIVRKILEAHGGRVWAKSSPGQGSTFTFVLPVCSDTGEAGPGRAVK